MSRLGFYFDVNRCIGCRACQMACKDKNNLETGVFFRRVTTYKDKADGRLHFFSGACNHCEDAACMNVCPVNAYSRTEEGVVLLDSNKCIGCGSCSWNCPYGEPKFSKIHGITRKCDACIDLLREGKKSACVDACNGYCLDIGDYDELREKYGDDCVSVIPAETAESNTNPSLLLKKLRVKTGQEGQANNE